MDHKQVWPKRRSFIFIEVLIAIIFLGILVGTVINRGQAEAQQSELNKIQLAVIAMMADNNITSILNPVTTPTSNMGAFPDATTPTSDKGLEPGDKAGYLLYGHDKTADDKASPAINYVNFANAIWTYTATSDGTVTQAGKR